ncbi:hypothetical protein [uncultured Shewanella sp.]|uniref:hypothetical protein n=1 Tax=uncultured Shewanella sp. TaxID=173975 RepID=UPI0026230498|nr:hypothetical protein [uncultured Shewanella sp.]
MRLAPVILASIFQLLALMVFIATAGFCADAPARRCKAILGRFTVSSLKPKLADASTRGFKSENQQKKKRSKQGVSPS